MSCGPMVEDADEFYRIWEVIESTFGHLMDPDLLRREIEIANGDVSDGVDQKGLSKTDLIMGMRTVMGLIYEIDERVDEVVNLATVSANEANRFQEVIMSSPEGRDLVESLRRQKPYMFEGMSFGKSSFS